MQTIELYHGTSPEVIRSISRNGFSFPKKSVGGGSSIFGPAAYFSTSSVVADYFGKATGLFKVSFAEDKILNLNEMVKESTFYETVADLGVGIDPNEWFPPFVEGDAYNHAYEVDPERAGAKIRKHILSRGFLGLKHIANEYSDFISIPESEASWPLWVYAFYEPVDVSLIEYNCS